MCLWLQDCPDGNYASLEKSGKKQKSKPWRELYNGFCNYRMWGPGRLLCLLLRC